MLTALLVLGITAATPSANDLNRQLRKAQKLLDAQSRPKPALRPLPLFPRTHILAPLHIGRARS